MHSSPPEGGDLRVIGRVRQVVETIGDRASGGRWEAVARLRLFCEGASLAEELEEIGSRKVSTMRTLVELLDELSPALGGDTAEARVLDDVVWILVRAAEGPREPRRATGGAPPRPRDACARARSMRPPSARRRRRATPRRSACCAA